MLRVRLIEFLKCLFKGIGSDQIVVSQDGHGLSIGLQKAFRKDTLPQFRLNGIKNL